MALSASGSKSSRKITSSSQLPVQPASPTASPRVPSARAKSKGLASGAPSKASKPSASKADQDAGAVRTLSRSKLSVKSNSEADPTAGAAPAKPRRTSSPTPAGTTRKTVEAVVKAVQNVASKASARSQSALPSRKVVHPASEPKAAAPARALKSGDSKIEKKTKAALPKPSAPAVETTPGEATPKRRSKKFLASAAPVREDVQPTSSAKRNREREALNLYTTAMESFKQTDYDRARDVLLLLLNDFVLESEIADRARVFLKICEQKLHPAML